MDKTPSVTTREGAPTAARRWLNLFAWLVVLVAAMSLAFGWLWPDLGDAGRLIAPLNWLAFMFRTFTPHAAIFLVLFALLAWLRKLRRPAWVMTALAACCAAPIGLSLLSRQGARIPDADALTIMSCNAQYGRADGTSLLARIDEHRPDVLVIQEYTPAMHARLGGRLRERMPHSAVAPRDDAFGMAIYSRREFVEPAAPYPALPKPDGIGRWACSEPQIRAVVSVGGRQVVVQGVHTLPPIRPSYLAEQRMLIRALAAWAAHEPRPVILAGDFNHDSASQSARWLSRAGLANAHAAAGDGRGLTWPDGELAGLWRILGFRIDHVFIGRGLQCEWSRVVGSIGSDHRPIVARVGIAATP